MKTIKIINVVIISLLVLFSCSPQKKKTAEDKVQTIKIMIESPEDGKPIEVQVKFIDGNYILGGDMIVEPYVQRAAGVRKFWRWPNGVIPFKIAQGHPNDSLIRATIKDITDSTKLCFRERIDEDDYVVIKNSNKCWSTIGRRRWGENKILLTSGCSRGSIIHELLHTAGLYHEHNRSDRDKWITINWDNIIPSEKDNFYIQTGVVRKDINEYDFSSIMHYGPYAWSKNSLPTIVSKIPGQIFGQRNGLSSGDIAAINAMYYDASDNNCSVETPLDNSTFISQNVPINVQLYESFEVLLTFNNSGPTTWHPGYKLVSLSAGWLIDEVPINQTVAPNDDVTIEFSVNALVAVVYEFQWQLSRPFGGLFGDTSDRLNIEVVNGVNITSCSELDDQLDNAKLRLKQWQDLLLVVSPDGKDDIQDHIRRVNGEIGAIGKQKDNLGCP